MGGPHRSSRSPPVLFQECPYFLVQLTWPLCHYGMMSIQLGYLEVLEIFALLLGPRGRTEWIMSGSYIERRLVDREARRWKVYGKHSAKGSDGLDRTWAVTWPQVGLAFSSIHTLLMSPVVPPSHCFVPIQRSCPFVTVPPGCECLFALFCDRVSNDMSISIRRTDSFHFWSIGNWEWLSRSPPVSYSVLAKPQSLGRQVSPKWAGLSRCFDRRV